jgi:hypothetical protein
MSFDLKCEVLRKLREEYCHKNNYKLTVNTENWRATLSPLVTSIISKGYAAQLPKHVEEKLTWLADNDAQAAQAILAASEAQESRNAVSLLEREFLSIEKFLLNSGKTSKITHTIKLPYGNIRLKIKRG